MPVYLLIINALAFSFMCLDKLLARKHLRRIPESVLLWAALLGGSLGALAGMLLARHKTRKPKFYITLPLLLAAQMLVLFFLLRAPAGSGLS